MPSLDRAAGKVYFRQKFTIPKNAKIKSAIVQAAADNSYELYINGQRVASGVAWINYGTHDISKLLKSGENVIAFIGSNGVDKPSPAGVLAGMRIELSDGKIIGLSSGKGWKTTDKKKDPFVRLWFNPVQQALTGWVNGEKLYNRHTNGSPWDYTFNPPLKPGHNRLIFLGKLGDYPTVSIRVHGHEGKTQISDKQF